MIVLMRHGEAENRAPSDAQRPLSERGRDQVAQSVQWILEQGIALDTLIASPYLRAQQSAQIARESFDLPIQTLSQVQPESEMREAEKALQDFGCALVCFHQPLISKLVLRWTGQTEPASTGAVFVLQGELLAPDWMSLQVSFCPN